MKNKLLYLTLFLFVSITSCYYPNNNSISSTNVSEDNNTNDVTANNQIMIDEINDITKLFEVANSETNKDKYMLYMAKIEALLLDKAIILPLDDFSSFHLTRIANINSNPIVSYGNLYYKYKDSILLNDFISNEDYNNIINLNKEEKIAYLSSKYTFNNVLSLYKDDRDLTTLDPTLLSTKLDISVLSNCFDSLFKIDDNGNVINDMVDSYFVDESKLTYTFKLKDNLYYIDNYGNKKDKIKAIDFVYGLNHYLDANNNVDLLENIVNVKEYINKRCDFNDVGIKVIDDKTFSIKLVNVDNDFINILSNNIIIPLNNEFFISHKGVFGIDEYKSKKDLINYHYANPLNSSSMIYCGAYYPTTISNDLIVLRKNPYYHDVNNVMIDTIYFYKDMDDISYIYEKVLENKYSSMIVKEELLDKIKNDNLVDYLIKGESRSLRYIGFNLNRTNYEINNKVLSTKTDEDKIKAKSALLNNDFRKAIFYCLDRLTFVSLSKNSEFSVQTIHNNFMFNNKYVLSENIISEYDDLLKQNTNYTEILSYYLNKIDYKIDLNSNVDGILNKELAINYFNKAKEVLDLNAPIILDVLCIKNNTISENQAKLLKDNIEGILGSENVTINIISTSSAYEYYLAGSSGAKCYDIYYDLSVSSNYYSDINILEIIYENLIK